MDFEEIKALFAPRNVFVYMTHAELNEGGVKTCVAMRRGMTAPWELTDEGKNLLAEAQKEVKEEVKVEREEVAVKHRGRPRKEHAEGEV